MATKMYRPDLIFNVNEIYIILFPLHIFVATEQVRSFLVAISSARVKQMTFLLYVNAAGVFS